MFPSITALISKTDLTPLPYMPIFDISPSNECSMNEQEDQISTIGSPELLSPQKHAGNDNNKRNSVKFTKEEDNKLEYAVSLFGLNNWSYVAKALGTKTVRQCRERWYNQLNPSLTKGRWTPKEDFLLIQKYAEFGPRWVLIAKYITNKSPVSIKLRWKRLAKKGNIETIHKQKVSLKTPSVVLC